MTPIQAIILLYAGMLIENPEKRKQFMGLINSAGASIEKTVNGFMSKGGAVKNEPAETTAPDEPTEFR